MPSRLPFIVIPLLLVFVPALLSIIRRSDDIKRLPKFLVVVAISSMVWVGLGMTASMAVDLAHGMIPGTASAGGHTGDSYYFFDRKHDVATPVAKEFWEEAFLHEQVAAHLTYIPFATFALSLATLYAMRRSHYVLDADAEPARYQPPLRWRFRLKAPIAPVVCVMSAFLVGDFMLTLVLADLGVNPTPVHMLLLVATIFIGAIASMITQRPQATVITIPGGFCAAYVATRMVVNLFSGPTMPIDGAPFIVNLFLALVFVALLFAASYKLVLHWTELPNRWR